MTAKRSIADTPFLVLRNFLFEHFFVTMFLMGHANDHIQDVQCVQDYFEVLIC